jgi:O-antigen ligase
MIKLPRWPFKEDKIFAILSFGVLFIPLAFTLLGYENYETIKFAALCVVAGTGLIIFVLRQKAGQSFGAVPKTLKWCLWFFLFWAALAMFSAVDFSHAFFGFYYRFTNGWLFYAAFVAVVFLLIKILSREKANFLAKILVFDAAVVGLVAIFQVFGVGYYESLDQGFFARAPSLLGNPNFSAMFLAMAAPWSMNLFVVSSRLKSKIYYGFVFFVCFAAIILLASRGALLAFVAACLVWLAVFLWQGRSRWKVLLAGFAAVVLLVGGVLFQQIVRPGSFFRSLQTADVNTVSRLAVWRTTWEAGKQHWLLGEGLGSFNIFFEQNHGPELAGALGEYDDAHNLFLQMYATGGLPLALGFLAVLLWCLWRCLGNLSGESGGFRRACLASVVAFAIAASFNPVSIPCFLALAVVLALSGAGGQYSPKQKKTTSALPQVLVFLLGLILGLYGLSLILGEQVFASAYRQYQAQNFKSSQRLVNIAKILHPFNSLYKIFQIGDEIRLHKNLSSVPGQIEDLKYWHPLESRSFLIAGKLSYLLYYETKDQKALSAAINNLKRAIALDPNYVERFGLLAAYEFEGNQTTSALAHVRWELSQKPDEFSGWLLLAKLAQTQGQKQQTVAALERAFNLKPSLKGLEYLLNQAKAESNIRSVPINVYLDEGKID